MKLKMQEYKARRILNVHRHVDGPWFWSKYSAHPYVGCRSGCEFCYCRGGHYLGRHDPETFDTLIRVKTNAVELLRKGLSGRSRDIINCGDWQQPAEARFQISRGMLRVIYDLAFPLFVVERSPLIARDLDLLVEINARAWAAVAFSISSLDPGLKHTFEPHSPGVFQRLHAMSQLASTGIAVGTALMPIIPLLGDRPEQLEEVIRATKDNGGTFVVAGGMTMDGEQAARTLRAAGRQDPAIEQEWRALYRWAPGGAPVYSPPKEYTTPLGRQVRELCARHGLRDRMPRYVIAGPLAVNKRIAERLFLRTYDLELEDAPSYLIWAYRKAAWTIDELETSVADIFRRDRETGLLALPTIGKGIAADIVGWLKTDSTHEDLTQDSPTEASRREN